MAKKQNVFNAGKKSLLPFAEENSSTSSTSRSNHSELSTRMSYGRENLGNRLSTMPTQTRHIGINNRNVESENESLFQQAMVSKETEENAPDYSMLYGPDNLTLALKYFGRLLRILETNPEIKKTLRGGAKQILCGAVGTSIGVFFVGPVGAAVGGVVGAVIGGIIADDYTPLIKVVRNLSDAEKQRLVKEVQNLVRSALIEVLERFITSQKNLEQLVNCVQSFLKKIKN